MGTKNEEIAGMGRIFALWRDPDHREPTLKIVYPYDDSRMRFGLFPPLRPPTLGAGVNSPRATLCFAVDAEESYGSHRGQVQSPSRYFEVRVAFAASPTELPKDSERDQIIREAFETGTRARQVGNERGRGIVVLRSALAGKMSIMTSTWSSERLLSDS